ncbi:Rer1 family protein [Perilla frutescens var. frutescens]|nr:Rer1 family protein [Perilla frutescens var. frutescens]
MEPTADASTADPSSVGGTLSQWKFSVSHRFQHLLDKSTPYVLYRWIAFLCIALIYGLRVYLVQGFYVVSYALGIYLLNLLVGFLSPQDDPEFDASLSLPIRNSQEFRPFVRRLPEFKFWYSITKAFCIAFVLTFISIFDVPVFWPILLFYWVMLCTLMLRKQILHMIKYKYVPFSFGKQLSVSSSVVLARWAKFWTSSGSQQIEAFLLGFCLFFTQKNCMPDWQMFDLTRKVEMLKTATSYDSDVE